MKQFEPFRLDTSNERLWRHSSEIPLPPKPFAVLRYLVENPGRLITHDELLDALWPETYVQPQVLRTYMLDLRKALGDDATQPRFIQTIPKRGYRFVAQVEECDPSTQPISTVAAVKVRTDSTLSGNRRVDAKPVPSSNPDFPRQAVFGREPEFAVLMDEIESLRQSQRKTLFITGEAGIGKTALVDVLCDRLVSSSEANQAYRGLYARGQCVSGFGESEQYYPVVEALRQLCAASTNNTRVCQILASLAPAWLASLGRTIEAPAIASPPVQERMPGDLCAAIEELASDQPLVLIFEDLQWADDSTLHLISALARRRAHARLMVLATYRPKELAPKHPLKTLKQDLLMRQLCTEIALSPLSRVAVDQMLRSALTQQGLPDQLTKFVYQHSEGNPLFVKAILEHLIAQDFLVQKTIDVQKTVDNVPRWALRMPLDEMEAGIPHRLAKMIELEIDQLSPAEQQMLEAGSLMNVAFPAWAVAAALEKDPTEIEEACDDLARRIYFLERAGHDELPDGTRSAFYVFSHGLYREALYQRQAASRRAKRHIRIAEKLAQSFLGCEASVAREIAVHYEAAGDWLQASHALTNAASQARSRKAYAETVQLLEHALRVVGNLNAVDRRAISSDLLQELEVAREAVNTLGSNQYVLCGKA